MDKLVSSSSTSTSPSCSCPHPSPSLSLSPSSFSCPISSPLGSGSFRLRPGFAPFPHSKAPSLRVFALVVDPSDSAPESVNDFVRRMEQAWLISKQPRPVSCVSCKADGHTECLWCRGTGFFILGDNMLCEVPSRNTKCLICMGQGSVPCKDCKGTGYIAKWLPSPSSQK